MSDAFESRRVIPPFDYEGGLVPLDDIWGSFFRSVADLAVLSVKAGVLDRDCFEDKDPFLYIGLGSQCLLESVMRSVGAPGLTMSHGVALADVSLVPTEMHELYNELLKAKKMFALLTPLTRGELEFLRQAALFSGDRDASVPPPRDEGRAKALLGVVSAVAGVATCVTQLEFYLHNFNDVVEDVLAECKAASHVPATV